MTPAHVLVVEDDPDFRWLLITLLLYRRLAHDSGADVFLNKRDTATALLPAIWGLTEGSETSA